MRQLTKFTLGFTISLTAFCFAQSNLYAQTTNYVPGEVIIKYQPQIGRQDVGDYSQVLDRAGVRYHYLEALYGRRANHDPILQNTFLVKLSADEQVDKAIAKLKTQPSIVYAEANLILQAFFTPNDPQWNGLWGMRKIQADQAWDVQAGNPNVIVAVVDTGVDLDHPDLQGKLAPGYDLVGGDNSPDDGHGHGTHVSGTAAAITNNSRNVAGVAGGNAQQNNLGVKIMPVRVLNSSGSGSMSTVARGIRWAADNGAYVINLSLGDPYNRESQALRDAVAYAWNQGVVVVAAAGNSSAGTCFPPAKYEQAICVIATTSSDTKAGFSNYGQYADVGAPGSQILSLWRGGQTRTESGTSMASPHVAGLAGLLYSFMPTRSTQNALAVRRCIENNLDIPPGWNTSWAPGRINALKAVNDPSCRSNAPSPTSGPSPTPGGAPTSTLSPTPTTTPAPTSAPPVQPTNPIPTSTLAPNQCWNFKGAYSCSYNYKHGVINSNTPVGPNDPFSCVPGLWQLMPAQCLDSRSQYWGLLEFTNCTNTTSGSNWTGCLAQSGAPPITIPPLTLPISLPVTLPIGTPAPTSPTTSPSTTVTITQAPQPNRCSQADVNADNKINQTDLDKITNSFGTTGNLAEDINQDQIVNGIDISIAMTCWGWQKP